MQVLAKNRVPWRYKSCPKLLKHHSSEAKPDLVNPVEDWEVSEECAGDKQGYYQVFGNVGTVEACVAIAHVISKTLLTSNKSRYPDKADLALLRADTSGFPDYLRCLTLVPFPLHA